MEQDTTSSGERRKRDIDNSTETSVVPLTKRLKPSNNDKSICDSSDNNQRASTMTMEDIRAFFLQDPITEEEYAQIEPVLHERLTRSLDRIEAVGPAKAYEQYLQENSRRRQQRQQTSKTSTNNTNVTSTDSEEDSAVVRGVPRSYQLKLVQVAMKRNTIVHLGTGMGKTMIALLLIKQMMGLLDQENDESSGDGEAKGQQQSDQTQQPNKGLSDEENKNHEQTPLGGETSTTLEPQVVFLVPSVALVLQQTNVLKANLPLSVGTAYHATVNSESSRCQLAQAQVLVATHGAFLDLLFHYGDLFSMKRVKLLILDECHNCIKNSPYAEIMRQFYHEMDSSNRPRILGLTASPLINVKPSATPQDLADKLHELEDLLDSKIVPLQELGLDVEEIPAFLRKDVHETMIHYRSTPDASSLPIFGQSPDSSSHALDGLHPKRQKEFRQIQHVYSELGPAVTKLFCQQLCRDLIRNTYEEESEQQFANAQAYLNDVVDYCQPNGTIAYEPYTPKLRALHLLLEQILNKQPDAVGLVFVQRRITAVALNGHFRYLMEQRKGNQSDSNPTVSSQGPPATATTSHDEGLENERQFDQFEDAEEDYDNAATTADAAAVEKELRTFIPEEDIDAATHFDQFADAEDDDGIDFFGLDEKVQAACQPESRGKFCSTNSRHRNHEGKNGNVFNFIPAIKSAALVRQPKSLFRLQSRGEGQDQSEEQMQMSLCEQETSIRKVLDGLRRRDINLLIATSVVEEGIDVQACSFVIVFDALNSLKGFIQMKGRARHKDASFFVFRGDNESDKQMNLERVKDVEARVNLYLASRDTEGSNSNSDKEKNDNPKRPTLLEELASVERTGLLEGEFRSKSGAVTLTGAKSLLHRYALMQPMDPIVRTSKAALRAHLPSFDAHENILSLPSHLGSYSDLSVIRLPSGLEGHNKKQRESFCCLLACVRLYQHSLLSERLLPLFDKDIEDKFTIACKRIRHQQGVSVDVFEPAPQPTPTKGRISLYLYPIKQSGDAFLQSLHDLNPQKRQLGLVTWVPLEMHVPIFQYNDALFGIIQSELDACIEIQCSCDETKVLTDFFELIWDARWRRRTKRNRFVCLDPSQTHFAYRVACLHDGKLDFSSMKGLVRESQRSKEERIRATLNASEIEILPRPRLWCPVYDEHATYVVHGPSTEDCSADFPSPSTNVGVNTYRDYYKSIHGKDVENEEILFDAIRQWSMPRRTWSEESESRTAKLRPIKLPRSLAMEAHMPDPEMSLLSYLLPQLLYHIESHYYAMKFIAHAKSNVPGLGKHLSQLETSKVLKAITAKSCNLRTNYEKLEWLGDGVLKLVQSDSLINATELKSWFQSLPEGYLNSARSFMGSNKYLADACRRLQLDKFIQTRALSKGVWTPSPCDLLDEKNQSTQPHETRDGKVQADVLESLIGLIYLEKGYLAAMECCDALQLTIPHTIPAPAVRPAGQKMGRALAIIVDAAEKFTGHQPFGNVANVEEALTHPTQLTLTSKTSYPSYQKLEWVGDAVLCLAIRKWIYKTFSHLNVGEMVLLESLFVCNETLAFLSHKSGLPQHLRHGDQTLPARIEMFEWDVREHGRGLWGTDPPKAISDIVEALFGAAHVDGGYEAGQKAVYYALGDILSAVQNAVTSDLEKFLQYPKRALLTELGGLVSLESKIDESPSPSTNMIDTPVWSDDGWTQANTEKIGQVSSLTLLNYPLLAVADRFASPAASNRTSAFFMKFLSKHPSIRNRVIEVKANIQRNSPTHDKVE